METIYLITNQINQKKYIGWTAKPLIKRWNKHKARARNEMKRGEKLYNSMRKYGIENFTIEVLEQGNDLLSKEDYYIKLYQAKLNIKPGGLQCMGWNWTEESKKKVKGKPKPPRTKEHSEAISKGKQGSIPWNKGLSTGQCWYKDKRTSPNVKNWKIKMIDKELEITNLKLWCEENNYNQNTLKARFYKQNFPYKNILSMEQI